MKPDEIYKYALIGIFLGGFIGCLITLYVGGNIVTATLFYGCVYLVSEKYLLLLIKNIYDIVNKHNRYR